MLKGGRTSADKGDLTTQVTFANPTKTAGSQDLDTEEESVVALSTEEFPDLLGASPTKPKERTRPAWKVPELSEQPQEDEHSQQRSEGQLTTDEDSELLEAENSQAVDDDSDCTEASDRSSLPDETEDDVDTEVTSLSRVILLHARLMSQEKKPFELEGLGAEHHASVWTSATASLPSKGRPGWRTSSTSDTPDRSMFRSNGKNPHTKSSERRPMLLARSEKAYKAAKPTEQLPREKQLQREVNSLLNKVCPENIDVIVARVAATEIRSPEELQLLISLIFKKALAEPHYCETYADMVVALRQRIPQFASQAGGKPVTFRVVLLNTTQKEFQSLSNILTLTAEEVTGMDIEQTEYVKKKRKDRVLANMRFIGQLFLRSLLNDKIIGCVIQELARCDDASSVPEEPMVECICELLTNIGFTLESSPAGKVALLAVCSRLGELKRRPAAEGRKCAALYSRRVQFAIEDLFEIRAAGWVQKSFKASAKTKEEIRRGQEMDLWAQASGQAISAAEHSIAGARLGVTPQGWYQQW